MKEITILSGKGGTGKTTITAALAYIANNSVLCDNDVDAADLHLILDPDIEEEHNFESGWKVSIDQETCTGCGICLEYCRFDAIIEKDETYEINNFKCEGCRLCERICPVEAIHSEKNNNNLWYISNTRFGKFIHAKMAPGEENSGKLVTVIRSKAKEIAKEQNIDFIINDGPPGIGCAAISSLSGTGMVLLVTEPTKTGLNDMERLLELIHKFNIPVCVIINKYDINESVALLIEEYLKKRNIELLAKIPFDEKIVEAMVEGKTINEYDPGSDISNSIKSSWDSLVKNF